MKGDTPPRFSQSPSPTTVVSAQTMPQDALFQLEMDHTKCKRTQRGLATAPEIPIVVAGKGEIVTVSVPLDTFVHAVILPGLSAAIEQT